MLANLTGFFIQLGITAVSLWVTSLVFNGIRIANPSSLIVSALLLGFANAVLWPLLVLLTLPLTTSPNWSPALRFPDSGLPSSPAYSCPFSACS